MKKINQKDEKFLLALARQTLFDYFIVGEKTKITKDDLPDHELSRLGATFVTLTKNGQLRGCVGTLKAEKPIYQDVIDNSLLAAFSDTRFPQVTKEELVKIKIEISILSEPKQFRYTSIDNLLEQIKINKHGIILQNGWNQATFLPQVWTELKSKEEFLEALSNKAGLNLDAWMDPHTKISYYTVQKFIEI